MAATVPVIIHDDVEEAADFLRPVLALYIGGMGARGELPRQRVRPDGLRGRSAEIQDLYLEGKKEEAAALVPMSLIEETALIGPKEKIRDDLEPWRESCVTTMLLYGDANTLRTMAELVL